MARAPTSESVIERLPLRAPGRPRARRPTALDDALPLPPLASRAEPLTPRTGDPRITFRAPTVTAAPSQTVATPPRRRVAAGSTAPPAIARAPRPRLPRAALLAAAAAAALLLALLAWALS